MVEHEVLTTKGVWDVDAYDIVVVINVNHDDTVVPKAHRASDATYGAVRLVHDERVWMATVTPEKQAHANRFMRLSSSQSTYS